VDEARISADLADAWELLAEPIQTVMRRHGVQDSYEKLKELTRGRQVDRAVMQAFIQGLEIPEVAKRRLLDLTPERYIGFAEKQAKSI
jgi:adenylosuccinate lyase